jgi:hypothetical protein
MMILATRLMLKWSLKNLKRWIPIESVHVISTNVTYNLCHVHDNMYIHNMLIRVCNWVADKKYEKFKKKKNYTIFKKKYM